MQIAAGRHSMMRTPICDKSHRSHARQCLISSTHRGPCWIVYKGLPINAACPCRIRGVGPTLIDLTDSPSNRHRAFVAATRQPSFRLAAPTSPTTRWANTENLTESCAIGTGVGTDAILSLLRPCPTFGLAAPAPG